MFLSNVLILEHRADEAVLERHAAVLFLLTVTETYIKCQK